MSKVSNENFVTIQGWMVNELKLKGNELLIYALIYGFSQDGEQRFSGSLQYICDWTNSTKAGVSKALKRLLEKGLIEKHDVIVNGVKFCEYNTTKFNGGMQQSLMGYTTKFNGGMQQSLMGYTTKFNGGMQQSCTNNILDNINNNILNNIDIDSGKPHHARKKEKPIKHKLGEYSHVLLTDEQLDKLVKDYGEADTQKAIKRLDEYIEETGKKYKNHNLTLRRWVFDAIKEKSQPNTQQTKDSAYHMVDDSDILDGLF